MTLLLETLKEKPSELQAIFLMYFAKTYIYFALFLAAKWSWFQVEGLHADLLLYTGFAYALSLLYIAIALLTKNIHALRLVIALDILDSYGGSLKALSFEIIDFAKFGSKSKFQNLQPDLI